MSANPVERSFRAHILSKQQALLERMTKGLLQVKTVEDIQIECHPRVFAPHSDTILLAKSINAGPADKVLDACAGTGFIAVYLVLTRGVKNVVATDVSPFAVANIKANAHAHKIHMKIHPLRCDLFSKESFDVIVMNPPYMDHPASSVEQQSVWDPDHAVVKRFFLHLPAHLNVHGRVYISWANFADFGWLESQLASAGLQFHVAASAKKQDDAYAIEYRVYEARY